MTDNPYQAPEADTDTSEEIQRRGPVWKGILIGLVVDMGATIIFGFAVGIAYGIWLAAQGYTPEEMQYAFEHMNEQTLIYALLTVIGAGFSVLGGYVCARIINHDEYRYNMILFAITTVLVILMDGLGDGIGWAVFGIGLTLLAYLFGAWLHRNSKTRRLAKHGSISGESFEA